MNFVQSKKASRLYFSLRRLIPPLWPTTFKPTGSLVLPRALVHHVLSQTLCSIVQIRLSTMKEYFSKRYMNRVIPLDIPPPWNCRLEALEIMTSWIQAQKPPKDLERDTKNQDVDALAASKEKSRYSILHNFPYWIPTDSLLSSVKKPNHRVRTASKSNYLVSTHNQKLYLLYTSPQHTHQTPLPQ